MVSDDDDNAAAPSKRRRTAGRRKAACQTCSLRKVKCDTVRPECFACQATGSECVYLNDPEEALTLNKAVEILSTQINGLVERLEGLKAVESRSEPVHQDNSNTTAPLQHTQSHETTVFRSSVPAIDDRQESSRDFSHIPPHKTTADVVLTWPIFENAFPQNYLIDPHLGYRLTTGGVFSEGDSVEDSILPSIRNVAPLDEHRIPALVDRFLENVHTKNPILDVEALVRKSREATSRGLGWDGFSCLLLLACALGLVAKPFGSEMDALRPEVQIDDARHLAAPTKERQQADHCFVQATRRLGSLRPSTMAAQCNFFAGVYLMYTLRPMLSWQYFHQASITYQLYLKMNGRITEDYTVLMHRPLTSPSQSSKTTRLEQRLYWSCFKSEAEFRVELPLPQSELASYEFPNLFPSPPSPSNEQDNISSTNSSVPRHSQSLTIANMLSASEDDEIKAHAKRLCNEEESWYYYLTEVALRRIGNRIINTFFRSDSSSWLNIEGLINVAIEFEAQVSTWQTNLPPAMQKYETNSTIRAPRIASPGGAETGFVSQELSWATENRLLEMRHWLYQPFIFYLVHARPPLPRIYPESQSPLAPSPYSITDDRSAFWPLISRAINCNLAILDTRSIPHRHHGLWFDLRAIICSSFLLVAVVKSGYTELIPGGLRTLIGEPLHSPQNGHAPSERFGIHSRQPWRTQGKFGRVLRQLEIWSPESPDMLRAREVLELLFAQISSML